MIIIRKLQILRYLKKMICHILVHMIYWKNERRKNTNEDDEYKEENSRLQDGNESVDNYETSYTLRDESIIKITKE